MKNIKGKFVTAKIKGSNESRQGVVVSLKPLKIRGQSGLEYECEGEIIIVDNPPENCIGCGLPLGWLCHKCERNLNALENAMRENGLKFTRLDIITKQSEPEASD